MAELNYATKYEKQFEAAFKPNSYFEGKVNNKYQFEGVAAIKIYSPVTVPLNDYSMTGNSRYGTPTEITNSLQEMKLTQDKGFTNTLDRRNYTDNMMAVSAAQWVTEETKGVVTPFIEKYAIGEWVKNAGTIGTISTKPTKTTVTEAFFNGLQALDDAYVPGDGRYIYVTAEMYKYLALSDEFLKLEALGEKSVGKGIVGELGGAKVVKLPTNYMPDDVYGFIARKDSILLPKKISSFTIKENPPGINGWLMEGRVYFDAFVLGAKANGVWALGLSGKQQATPTISHQTNSLTITSADSGGIYYTTDGSDPRFSDKRQAYAGAVSTASWATGSYTIKAVAYGGDTTPLTSAVAEQSITIS